MGFSHARPNVQKIAEVLGVDKQALEDALKKYTFGGFAKVWAVDNKEKYSVGYVTIGRKNKESGAYETEFQDGFVRFVGRAHELVNKANLPTLEENKAKRGGSDGLSIKITNCDTSNFYKGENGKVSYSPHYTIFDFETPDAQNTTTTKANNASSTKDYSGGEDGFMDVPDGVDEALPFN